MNGPCIWFRFHNEKGRRLVSRHASFGQEIKPIGEIQSKLSQASDSSEAEKVCVVDKNTQGHVITRRSVDVGVEFLSVSVCFSYTHVCSK